MSNKYKFRDQTKPYFVTFTVVYRIDIFIINGYKDLFLDCLRHCQKEKGLEILFLGNHDKLYTSHYWYTKNKMEDIMRDLKSRSSKKLKDEIKSHPQESRREWMLWLMERAGKKNSRNKYFQFWKAG